jgi:DeoR family transcriptional regulator of aga operon
VSAQRLEPALRQDAIAERLRDTGSVTIAEVEALFGVSPVTVRRDLEQLERRGVVRRTHGGAVLPAGTAGHATDRAPEPESARALAEAAADMLAPRDSLFLDSSALSFELARRILETGLSVTLLTNSVRVMHLVFVHAGPGIDLIGLGGTLARPAGSFVGPATVRAVGEHFADRLFLGVAGVTAAGMLTESDPLEAEIKRAMIAQAGAAVLLLDAATLAGHGLNAVAEVTRLSAVIAAGVAPAALGPVRAPAVALHLT